MAFVLFIDPKGTKHPSSADSTQSASNSQGLVFYKDIGHAADGQHQPTDTPLADHLTEQYTLELKHFSSQSDAEKELERLAKLGIDAYFTPVISDGKVLYRVRRGIYPSQVMANRAAQDLKKMSRIESTVVKLY